MPDDTIRDRIGDFWDGLIFRCIGALAGLMTEGGRDTFATVVRRGMDADIQAVREAVAASRLHEADE